MVKNPPSTVSSQKPQSVARAEESSSRYTCRYFKVPADQRSANPEVYKPHLFSLGPYHAARFGPCNILASRAAGSLHVSPPQQQPDSAASADVTVEGRSCSFCTAVSSCVITDGDHFKHLAAEELGLQNRSQLIAKIKKHDPDLRKLYVHMSQAQLDLDTSCLADLLALDGIAIVAATMPENTTQLIYSMRRLILSDAILLENQVPILVVMYAVESIAGKVPPAQAPTLKNVLQWYLERMSPFDLSRINQRTDEDLEMKNPLLHYIYDYLTQANYRHIDIATCTASTDTVPALPSASHLARFGVRFRPCEGSFKDIQFDEKNIVLHIPKIQVTDTTVRFLHNLLAYEATARYPEEFSVISYIHFMDRLIDTEDDSQVLVEAGVIVNALGSHADLATMWNKLGISVLCRLTPKDCHYMKQLEALTKRRSRRWRAAFKELYWERQPWLVISLLAASILLVMTLLQTIYTVKASFAPPAS